MSKIPGPMIARQLRPWRLYHIGLLVLMVGGMWGMGTKVAPAQASRLPGLNSDPLVQLDLSGEVEIRTLLEYLSRRLKKPLVYTDAVLKRRTAKVFIPRGVQVKQSALVSLINVILEMEKISIAVDDNVIRVVNATDSMNVPRNILGPDDGTGAESPDTWVTKIFKLEHLNALQAPKPLQSIGTKGSKIIPIAEQNLLVVHEIKSNMPQITKAIKMIDVEPEKADFETINLKNADPREIMTLLRPFQTELKKQVARVKGGVVPTFSPHVRTNSFVIYGTQKQRRMMRDVILHLDVPSPPGTRGIHIYKVRNSNAEELAKVLETLFSKKKAAEAKDTKGAGSVPLSDDSPSIVAVKDQNALIVVSDRKNFEELLLILHDLDRLRPQVLIETTIVEMTFSKAEEFGIELASTKEPSDGNAAAFGATAFGLSSFDPTADGLARVPIPGAGLVAGVWKDSFNKVPVIVKASQSDNDVDLLAVPKLMTNDNEPAELRIIERQPFDQNTVNSDGNITSTGFGGYNEAGITLKITPHISEADHLRLEIEQNVDAFVPSVSSATQPAVLSRSAKAAVTIPDRSTVVLGGLTRNDKTKRVTKVPFMGDIPVLGHLFRSSSWDDSNVSLYIFIKPHIMRTLYQATEHTRNYQVDVNQQRAKRDAKKNGKKKNKAPKLKPKAEPTPGAAVTP